MSTVLAIPIVLFQPFWEVTHTRNVWNIIDLIIATGLIIWVIIDVRIKKKTENTKR